MHYIEASTIQAAKAIATDAKAAEEDADAVNVEELTATAAAAATGNKTKSFARLAFEAAEAEGFLDGSRIKEVRTRRYMTTGQVGTTVLYRMRNSDTNMESE